MNRRNIGYIVMVGLKQLFDIDHELIGYSFFLTAFLVASSSSICIYTGEVIKDIYKKTKALAVRMKVSFIQYKEQFLKTNDNTQTPAVSYKRQPLKHNYLYKDILKWHIK